MIPQLSTNPLCSLCKTIELTKEEMNRSTVGSPAACWFCIATTLIHCEDEGSIPEPYLHGRSELVKNDEIAKIKEKLKKPVLKASDFLADKNEQILENEEKPIMLSDNERKEFITKFGCDPYPKSNSTVITAYGATEETFLQFKIPVQIPSDEKQELHRIMQNMVNIFGSYSKYGGQFTKTLLELQKMDETMFLGGSR